MKINDKSYNDIEESGFANVREVDYSYFQTHTNFGGTAQPEHSIVAINYVGYQTSTP